MDIITSLQGTIAKYLSVVQFASWHVLKRNIENIYMRFPEKVEKNLEYQVLYPLLRYGIIEVARRPESDRLVYCLGQDLILRTENNGGVKIIPSENSIECIQITNFETAEINREDSLAVLERLPSMYAVITNWDKSETEMRYVYKRFSENHFRTARDTSYPDIYTSGDRVYSSKYVRVKNGTLYRIPEKEDNIDGLNIASSYLEIIKGYPLFFVNRNGLTCKTFHGTLPFVICRALILCDPMLLIDGRVRNKHVHIHKITDAHIKELKRIFGEKAVGEARSE